MAARLHRMAADLDRGNVADCQVHVVYDEVFAESK
jgi:hypothetical protein